MSYELIVLVTCPASESERIARSLVDERLAACVNIVPAVTSVFRWQGAVSTESEHLLVIKSNQGQWSTLEMRTKELHTYDTPEILCLRVEDGYKPYLEWLNSSVGQGK